MIRTLVFIAILIALAFGGAWLVEQPGQVVVTLPRYGQVSTTLVGAAAAVLGFVIAILALWTVLRFLLRLPSILSFTAKARKRARGFTAVSRGMIAVGAGDPRSAKRYAADAAKLLGKEPLALLLKAQAAQMAGDRTQAEGAFRQMLDEPETRVLGLRGLFVEARRKGDSAAAKAYAAEAARLSPSVAWAGEALLEFQCAEQDWSGAIATLDRGARGLDKAAVKRQRAVLLTADALARAEREPEAALLRAQQAVKLAPGLTPAATLAARLHARRGELRRASKVVEAAWAQAPHPDLAAAYLNVRPGDSARDRLNRAEKLLALRPHEAEGRIAVAEAALGARDFKRARSVIAPLLEGRPSTRVCLLMADLEEADTSSAGAVREWLSRASRAPRDPAWIADGVIADRWSPVSPVTGRLDAFVWGAPVEQIQAPAADAAQETIRPRPELAPPPSSDDVIADVDEAPAPVLTDATTPADASATTEAAPAETATPADEPARRETASTPPGPESAVASEPTVDAKTSVQPWPAPSTPSADPTAAPATASDALPATPPETRPERRRFAPMSFAERIGRNGGGAEPASPPAETRPEPAVPDRTGPAPDAPAVGATPAGEPTALAGPLPPAPQPAPPAEHAPSHASASLMAAAPAIEARPRRGSRPSEVVFPLASAPDDPGPDLGDAAARSRGGFLQ
ncbi:heme biosynthesis HemY N-terminal domain-containing protein [Alsobacter sp. KACC 23698]|uniref:Heme biosynthesis HemY N-terminal domain-containing protein n=1 Tax=Alsobacter sp. KACC 23698 TaxID=3149229 RepID=A0AAU7JED8_9HYPH